MSRLAAAATALARRLASTSDALSHLGWVRAASTARGGGGGGDDDDDDDGSLFRVVDDPDGIAKETPPRGANAKAGGVVTSAMKWPLRPEVLANVAKSAGFSADHFAAARAKAANPTADADENDMDDEELEILAMLRADEAREKKATEDEIERAKETRRRSSDGGFIDAPPPPPRTTTTTTTTTKSKSKSKSKSKPGLTLAAMRRLPKEDLERAIEIAGLGLGGGRRTRAAMIDDLFERFESAEAATAKKYLEDAVASTREAARLKRAAKTRATATATAADDVDDEEEEDEEENLEELREMAEAAGVPFDEVDKIERDGELSEEDERALNYVHAFQPGELVDILLRARGVDVVHIPLGERCKWTEHFIIATAKSPRHIRMLAGAALHAVKSRTRCVPYTGSHTTALAW